MTVSVNQKPVVLKTPQSIVHIKHSISLRQYKYWVLLLRFYREFFEQSELPDKDGFYTVPIAKIGDYMGYEPVKQELKTDFEGLRKEPIIINFLDKDGKKATHGMGFISEWKITSKTIAFKIPSFLEKAVKGDIETKNIFQLLNWNIFNSFNGKYEAIIYKLCKDYIGVGRTPYMTVSEYREYIGLKESEYIQFFELNRWTVSNPIKAINKNEISDIEVAVEFKRVGRKVEGLYFTIKHKKQTTIPFPDFEPHPAFTFAKVSISIQDQHKYLATMTPELIEATIRRVNIYAEELKKQGKPVNLGGAYKKAFDEDWGTQQLEQDNKANAEKAKVIEKKRAEQEKVQTEKELAEKKAKQTTIALEKFEALHDSDKRDMIEEFLALEPEITKGTLQEIYKKWGFEVVKKSPIFKGSFVGFLKKNIL